MYYMWVRPLHVLRSRWGESCRLLLRIICSDVTARPNYASSRSTITAIQRSCMVALSVTVLLIQIRPLWHVFVYMHDAAQACKHYVMTGGYCLMCFFNLVHLASQAHLGGDSSVDIQAGATKLGNHNALIQPF